MNAGVDFLAPGLDARSSLPAIDGRRSDIIVVFGYFVCEFHGAVVAVDVLGFRYLLSHSYEELSGKRARLQHRLFPSLINHIISFVSLPRRSIEVRSSLGSRCYHS